MPVPIICLDDQVRPFAERFRQHVSKPQYQYFVIVLLGLMLCEGTRTLSGLLHQIAKGPSLAGLGVITFFRAFFPAKLGRLTAPLPHHPAKKPSLVPF